MIVGGVARNVGILSASSVLITGASLGYGFEGVMTRHACNVGVASLVRTNTAGSFAR